MLQRPLELGADIVVYSTTKHMDGHGRTLGGAVLGSAAYIETELNPLLQHTGPTMSPFTAWVVLKGLETLRMRVERMAASALELARWLESQPGVAAVRHPWLPSHPQHELAHAQMSGGGTLVAFELAGGRDAAFRVLDALRLVDISNNLGDSRTLAVHWIDANLERDLSLEALARRAAMSTRTLSRRFREQLGSSPAQWVSRRRIRRSQELLETTAHSIERVASLSGFASVSSFRARFQQTVGNAPQSYRKMFRGS